MRQARILITIAALVLWLGWGCSTIAPRHQGLTPLEARQRCVQELTKSGMASAEDFIQLGRKKRSLGDLASDSSEKLYQYRCAIAAFEGSTVLSSREVTAYLESAELYFQLRDLTAAARNFHKVLELNPKTPGVHFRLAQIARNEGNTTLARRELAAEIFINPTSDSPWVERGNMEMSAKKFEAALVNFRKACALNSRNSDAFFGSGTALLLLDRLEEAEGELVKGISATDHASPALFWQLGLAYQRHGKRAEALETFRKYRSVENPAFSSGIARADEKILELSKAKK